MRKFKNTIYQASIMLTGLFIWTACSESVIENPFNNIEEDLTEIQEGVFLWENDEIGQFLRQNPSNQNRLLAQIRQATVKYQKFETAVNDGYMLDHCVQHPELGGMGHHAANMGLIMSEFDPLTPEVLLYEPMPNGKLKLVGVEYIIPSTPLFGDEVDTLDPPMLGDVPFDNHRRGQMVPVLDEHGNEVLDENNEPVLRFQPDKGGPPLPHYQLHVWIWKANPSGMYFPFNPNVSCQYAQHDHH